MVLTDRPSVAKGDADYLFIGVATDDPHRALLHWAANTPGMHQFVPDYHRLQLEHWIWTFRHHLIGKDILDIGAQTPRRWLGDGYRTFGNTVDVQADIKGDLLKLDELRMSWGDVSQVDAIICTEVLEHCENPFTAVANLYDALKPGGLLLVTSPFIWPDHRTDEYADYFRFTEQGWHLLMRAFDLVIVSPTEWTSEAKVLLDLVRRFEGWGFRHHVQMHTGYMVEAHKGA